MWADSLTRSIERSTWADSLGTKAALLFSRVVRPGPIKDLLSGTWLAHPVHPMLTDVTIGAWTSSFVLDVLPDDRAGWAADALVALGTLSAVPTVLTGLSDLADITDGEERAVGVYHALGNLTAVALYGMSFLARTRGSRSSGKALALLGATVASAAGFLGGHLAYRKGVGVDQTTFEDRPVKWTPVLEDGQLSKGKARRVRLPGADILLYRSNGAIQALANRCSHRGGPLHKGKFENGCVTCPWHLSTFRLEDGSIVRGPATAPQPAYDVRLREGRIEVRVRH
ncbi:MAG: Rieske 2Fe-2S domain-containing protein [Actinomycetota bacterium]